MIRRPQGTPIRILELRSVRGTGGGPEKTILQGTARSDSQRFAITVCYIRDARDEAFVLDQAAARLPMEYVEVRERHSFDPAIWTPLRRLVRERQIDIVHAHEYKTNLIALLLARADGVIPLSTSHGWTGHSPRERWIYYPADKWLLRHFPRVIAVSSEIRETLLRRGARPDSVVTVLNGIDPELFSRRPNRVATARAGLGLPSSTTVIGALGRLEPQKRFDVLMQAFAALRTTRPDVRLVIVGTGSLHTALAAEAARLGVTHACIFAGHRTDVVDVLHAFDVLVQSSDYEGTPNAVLEAMAVETPVVATDVGGTRELVYDGVHGLIVPPRRPDLLASAIANVLDDAVAAARRARAARQRVEGELSFEARMRTIERIYEELVATRADALRGARAIA